MLFIDLESMASSGNSSQIVTHTNVTYLLSARICVLICVYIKQLNLDRTYLPCLSLVRSICVMYISITE